MQALRSLHRPESGQEMDRTERKGTFTEGSLAVPAGQERDSRRLRTNSRVQSSSGWREQARRLPTFRARRGAVRMDRLRNLVRPNHVEKELLYPRVGCHLGMESASEEMTLAHENREFVAAREHLDTVAHAGDAW